MLAEYWQENVSNVFKYGQENVFGMCGCWCWKKQNELEQSLLIIEYLYDGNEYATRSIW